MAWRQVTIFHQIRPDHLSAVLGLDMPVDNVRKVASFDTDLPTHAALDEAFRLTNHHRAPWTLRKDIRAEPGSQRSTSIGDVVMVGTEAYQCIAQGWKKLRAFKA